MGINGNSCYKTHYFLNANLTIIGEFGNSGQKWTNTNQSNRTNLFCALMGRNPLRIFFIISGSSIQKYF